MQRCKRMLHKPSGVWYWVEVKQIWNALYYSFDGGDTWHKTKVAAYSQAEQTGKLEIA